MELKSLRSLPLALALIVAVGCAPEPEKPATTASVSSEAPKTTSPTGENPNTMSLAGNWQMKRGEETLDLMLKEDGTVELKISKGTETPSTDSGSWEEGPGKVLMHLHRGSAHLDLAFDLKDDKLVSTDWPKDAYGEEVLTFARP